ncbi:MAG: hypothetical protein HZA77_03790 [Candidatus Schekmanbacteria bacterium]|nr:hypothetical protein [Candidatus Schekmanbacteria bacterium]
MTNDIKSGQAILDEFFSQLESIDGVDKEVASVILKLYHEGKLTNINLSNELSSLRERK